MQRMEKPSKLLAGNPKNVYMVPRPGRSERTPVKTTAFPLTMLNLVGRLGGRQCLTPGHCQKLVGLWGYEH